MSAAIEQNVSPRSRGSRPMMTRPPCGRCDFTYLAMPMIARRTLAKVNSSAMTARHPEVPNLIWVVAIGFLQRGWRFLDAVAEREGIVFSHALPELNVPRH